MKLSKIFHIAADKYLHKTSGFCDWGCSYSCCAIEVLVYDLYPIDSGNEALLLLRRIKQGLRAMGLNPKSTGAFREIPQGPERQAARYMWLKWCALMSEEQGE